MEYTDLMGRKVAGEVWCQGPRDKTIWVIRPNGTAAVVNPTKRVEVEYEAPVFIPPVASNLLELAEKVNADHKAIRKELAALGPITFLSPELELASAILKHADAADKSRLPFINAHGGRAPISDKRLREIAAEEIER